MSRGLCLFGLGRRADQAALAAALAPLPATRDLGPPRIAAAGPLAAIVAETLAEDLRPARRNLLAHMRALEAAGRAATLLPMRFGQVVGDAAALAAQVAPRAAAILAEIERLSGCVEFAVRLRADRQAAIEAVVAEQPALREEFARLAPLGEAARPARIELGRRVGGHLAAWRDAAEARAWAALEAVALDRRRETPAEDIEVLRASLLIRAAEEEALEAALARAADAVLPLPGDRVAARLVGPSPPSSFVAAEIAAIAPAPAAAHG